MSARTRVKRVQRIASKMPQFEQVSCQNVLPKKQAVKNKNIVTKAVDPLLVQPTLFYVVKIPNIEIVPEGEDVRSIYFNTFCPAKYLEELGNYNRHLRYVFPDIEIYYKPTVNEKTLVLEASLLFFNGHVEHYKVAQSNVSPPMKLPQYQLWVHSVYERILRVQGTMKSPGGLAKARDDDGYSVHYKPFHTSEVTAFRVPC